MLSSIFYPLQIIMTFIINEHHLLMILVSKDINANRSQFSSN